jgi:hypothetical protein
MRSGCGSGGPATDEKAIGPVIQRAQKRVGATSRHTLAMSPTGRRRIAIGLVITAPLIVAIAMAAHANQVYVYARVSDHPYLFVGIAALMLALAARLALARRTLRITTYVAVGLVAVPALGVFIVVNMAWAALGGGATEQGTVATSPHFEVVAYQGPVLFRSDILVLVVRNRAGLFSRDGDEIACFMAPGTPVPSSWLFGQARFSAPDQLQISAADATTWWLTFDTSSLKVADELDRCTTAPDPAAD